MARVGAQVDVISVRRIGPSADKIGGALVDRDVECCAGYIRATNWPGHVYTVRRGTYVYIIDMITHGELDCLGLSARPLWAFCALRRICWAVTCLRADRGGMPAAPTSEKIETATAPSRTAIVRMPRNIAANIFSTGRVRRLRFKREKRKYRTKKLVVASTKFPR